MAKKAEFSIETVKKYVFWAVMPIGIITAVATTFMAVGQVSKAFNEKKAALESQKQAVEKIRGEAGHPNEETIKEIENCTKQLRGRVQSAWITLEKDQKLRNKWPVAPGPEFVAEVSKLKFGDEITIDSREHYLNFVEKYLPQLENKETDEENKKGIRIGVDRRRVQYRENGKDIWKEVDWTKEKTSAGSAGMGGDAAFNVLNQQGASTMDGTGGSFGASSESQNYQVKVDENGDEIERMVGVVDWPSPETRMVTASWERLPRSNEVWFAQEELWVYAALLSVIRKSNEDVGATGPHNAAVKRIENLLIGQAAAMTLSSQLKRRPGKSGAGAEGMSMESSMSGGSGMSGSGGEGGPGTGMMVAKNEADVITIKKQFRYVDDKGEPLAADAAAPFAQFNRMPVVLRMVVDQRRIPEIMVNCANCDMPIDVLRIIINPGGSKPLELSAYEAAAGASAGGSESSSDMGGGGGGEGGAGYGGGRSSVAGSSGGGDNQVKLDGVGGMYGSNAVPIEIYGRISIFNPVSQDLTVSAEETSAAASEAAPADETPASPAAPTP